jgi:hypothetical protein
VEVTLRYRNTLRRPVLVIKRGLVNAGVPEKIVLLISLSWSMFYVFGCMWRPLSPPRLDFEEGRGHFWLSSFGIYNLLAADLVEPFITAVLETSCSASTETVVWTKSRNKKREISLFIVKPPITFVFEGRRKDSDEAANQPQVNPRG